MNLLIHAPNVHQGGGKTLLLAALQGVGAEQPCTLIADARLGMSGLPVHIAVERFAPTLIGRLAAEWRLRSLAKADDLVLCMGNLPPLLGCRAKVSVFLQNRYLCDNVPLRGFACDARLRIAAERIWLRLRLRPDIRLLVQTTSMRRAVQQTLGADAEVTAYFNPAEPVKRQIGDSNPPIFLYPASPEPHKNHVVLIEAWRLLQQQGVMAELHLTVAQNTPLAAVIEHERAAGLALVNHGHISSDALAALYLRCNALIYPSLFEAYGLPLLEARAAGVPIIAAERDYVRDVVVPEQTFDPESPISIARAIKRMIGMPEKLLTPLTPAEFIGHVIADRG